MTKFSKRRDFVLKKTDKEHAGSTAAAVHFLGSHDAVTKAVRAAAAKRSKVRAARAEAIKRAKAIRTKRNESRSGSSDKNNFIKEL